MCGIMGYVGHRSALPILLDGLRRLEYRGYDSAGVAVLRTRGAYAIVVLCSDQPDRMVAVRQISPLIIGLGKGETILASDIPALLSHTRDVLVIEDGEMAVMTASGATVERLDGATVAKQPLRITWDAEMAEKGGYPHFMLKEIHEQPRALQETMMGRLDAPGAR